MKSLSAIVLTLSLTTCAQAPQAPDTLYDQLGGRDGIARIAGRFIAGIADEPEIRPYFLNTNLERFYEMFGKHLCQVADGPCQYEGDSMEETHIGMDIGEADFNRVVAMLVDAMEAEAVPYRVQNRLLARLAPMREDIIDR